MPNAQNPSVPLLLPALLLAGAVGGAVVPAAAFLVSSSMAPTVSGGAPFLPTGLVIAVVALVGGVAGVLCGTASYVGFRIASKLRASVTLQVVSVGIGAFLTGIVAYAIAIGGTWNPFWTYAVSGLVPASAMMLVAALAIRASRRKGSLSAPAP